jgi:hypothetical protein
MTGTNLFDVTTTTKNTDFIQQPTLSFDHKHRRAQTDAELAVNHRLLVTFNNTIFLNNSIGGNVEGLDPQGGIIKADPTFHDLVLENCLFLQNNFYFPDTMVSLMKSD